MLRNFVVGSLLVSLLLCGTYANCNVVSPLNCFTLTNFYIKALAGESWELHDTVTSPGTSFVTNSTNSVMFAGGIGYRFFPFLRAEFEYSYRPNYQLQTHSDIGDITDRNIGFADIKAQTGIANIYLDYPCKCITPYLLAGIGYSIINYGVTSIYNVAVNDEPVGIIPSNKNHNFVKQAGLGSLFYITKNLSVDLSYRFIDMGTIRSGNGLNVVGPTKGWPHPGFFNAGTFNQVNLKSNELLVGIHYDF